MFRIYQDKKVTDIDVFDVEKVVVEKVKEFLQEGICIRVITIFTENGTYSIRLEGAEKALALKEPEPDEVRF